MIKQQIRIGEDGKNWINWKKAILALGILVSDICSANPIMDLNKIKTDWFMDQYNDTRGTHIKTMRLEHEGRYVSFQYQHWKVINSSVCGDISKDDDLQDYSRCTQTAKRMFAEACEKIADNSKDQMLRAKKMFCDAAVSYKPVIVQIERSQGLTADQEKKQRCSLAVLEGRNLAECK